MLKAFVSGLGAPGATAEVRLAPWEWACEDAVLGAGVSSALRGLGVRSDLCVVGVATADEKKVAMETFERLLKMIVHAARSGGQATQQPNR